MMKKTLAITLAAVVYGCMTDTKVESTKTWEGHYFTVEEMHKATDQMQLDKDESIWIMSNHTLNRLLKNTRK